MIRKLKGGKYRLYSRKVNPKTGGRRNLGIFNSRKAAEQHERDIQYFKRHEPPQLCCATLSAASSRSRIRETMRSSPSSR